MTFAGQLLRARADSYRSVGRDMSYRASSPDSSALVRVLTAGVHILLISVLLALAAAACGGQASVDFFPQHDAQVPPDLGRESYVGKLVLKNGCLRAEAPPRGGHDHRSRLIIWPRSFTLSTEGGSVHVVDPTGRIAARVGDHVRFNYGISRAEAARNRSRYRELEKELPRGCPGPFMSVGDEVTAIIPDEPTTLTLQLPDGELYFRRQKTYLGQASSPMAEAVGKLFLDGECLRLKSEYSDRTHFISWPPGFTPHVHRGVVHVRNGGGRIIAQVGDRLFMGGGYGRVRGEKCAGPSFGANSIEVLSESESP